MPDHDQLAKAATRAIKAAIAGAGSPAAFASAHAIAERTVDRLASGDKPVPPGLAREVAAALDHTNLQRAPEHAASLRAWADAHSNSAHPEPVEGRAWADTEQR